MQYRTDVPLEMPTETLPDEMISELAEIEESVVLHYRLADAIREGASLVKEQARGQWISGDTACAFGAAYLAVTKRKKEGSL